MIIPVRVQLHLEWIIALNRLCFKLPPLLKQNKVPHTSSIQSYLHASVAGCFL